MRRLVAALIVLAALATPASAHTRSQSQSSWRIDGDAIEVVVEADAVDVTRLYALGGDEQLTARFATEAATAFDIAVDGAPCSTSAPPQASSHGSGRIVATMRFVCPAGALQRGPINISSQLFLRVAPSHLHFAIIRDAQGQRSAEAALTESNPSATLILVSERAEESFWRALERFIPVGAYHVWSGLDHVAFILALTLLVGGQVRRVIFAATGFTLGHMATLGLATIGVLRPDNGAIEALIGFTIAFVALEIGRDGDARMRRWSPALAALLALVGALALLGYARMSPLMWFGLAAFVFAYPRAFPRGATWIAAVFGLIHGCGFAGALVEIDLPPQRLVASLLGFNIGVELGQVVIIAAAFAIAWVARKFPRLHQEAAVAAVGAVLFALGSYWFVSRLL